MPDGIRAVRQLPRPPPSFLLLLLFPSPSLIASAQRVEHCEISAYGTLRAFAEELGFDKHVKLLQKTLDEEGNAHKLLTGLAEARINRQAE